MRQTIFENDFMNVNVEVLDDNWIYFADGISVNLKDPDNTLVKFHIDSPIIEGQRHIGDFFVNETSAAVEVLDKLFGYVTDDFKFPMEKKLADYLIKTSGSQDVIYEKGFVYNLPRCKSFMLMRLEDVVNNSTNEDANAANLLLMEAVENAPASKLKNFAANDLVFVPKSNGMKVDKKDDIFGKVAPIYSCIRRKVGFLLKDVEKNLSK